MVKNSPSLGLFIEDSSSKKEQATIESFGNAPIIIGCSFKSMVAKFGIFRALKSYFVRYRYIACLWLVREIYLWKALNQRYNDIPESSKEKVILTFGRKHPIVKKLVAKAESVLSKRLICNPLKPSLTVNNNNKKLKKHVKKTTC